jgi:hypothetical protein
VSYEGSRLAASRLPSSVPLTTADNVFSNKNTVPNVVSNVPSTNLLLNSDGALSRYSASNVTDAPGTISNFTNAVAFGNNSVLRSAFDGSYTMTLGFVYTFSCFVQMDDGSAPVPGTNASSAADFAIMFGGTGLISSAANCVVTLAYGNVYRVSLTFTASSTTAGIGVAKYTANSAKTFKVTGYQLEQQNLIAPSAILTRSSVATLDSVDYAANVPRYSQGGVLVEEAGTNLLTNTDGGIATYNINNVTSATTAIANFANSIQFGDNSVLRYAAKGYGATSGTVLTFSFYIQMDDGGVPVRGFSAGLGGGGDFYTATNNGEGQTPTNSLVERISGSIYRVSGTFTVGASGMSNIGVYKITNSSSRGFRVTGFQLEAKPYVTSYIDSGATAGTRSADVLRIPNLGFVQGGWAFAFTMRRTTQLLDPIFGGPTVFNYGSSLAELCGIYLQSIGNAINPPQLSFIMRSNDTGYNIVTNKTIAAGIPYRIAITGNGSVAKIAVDGVIVGTLNYVEPLVPIGSTCQLGKDMSAIFSNFALVYKALTDQELQDLSLGSTAEVNARWTLNNQLTAATTTAQVSDYIETTTTEGVRYDFETTAAVKAKNGIVVGTTPVSGASLTRSSAATINGIDYVANAPRYINNGLLVEETTTNLLLYSDATINNSKWNLNVSNATTPINNFQNSVQFGDNSQFRILAKESVITPTIGTPYAFSCYVQMNDGSAPVPSASPLSGDFCIIINENIVSENIKVTQVGWTSVYRVSATFVAVTNGQNVHGLYKYTTQSSKGFRASGYQLELKGYLTSYAESAATAFTRAAEVLTVPTAGWTKNSWAFGMTIRRTTTGLTADRSLPVIMRWSITAGTNDILIYIDNSADATRENAVLWIRSNGTSYRAESLVPIKFHAEYRIAITGDGRTAKMAINGVIVASMPYVEPLGTIPGFITIGEDVSGVYSDISIINRALSDYDLCKLSLGSYVNAVAEWTLNNQLSAKVNTVTLASDPTLPMHAVTKQYVDSKLVPTIVVNEIPSGTINGTNRVFTVQNTPISGSLELFQNGIVLLPTTHYTISGSTITYVSGFQPVVGETHCVHYRY